MLSYTYIAFAIIAVCIFTVYMAIMHVFHSNKLSQKVKSVAENGMPLDDEEEEEEEETAFSAFCQQVVRFFNLQNLTPRDLTVTLARAGITSPNAVNYYLFCRFVLQPMAMVMAIYSMYSTFFSGPLTTTSLLYGLGVTGLYTFAGLRGTQLYIDNRKAKRHLALTYSFPEMLDLMLVCIEAGLGLDAALNRVSKELRSMYPDIVAELDRTRLELTLLNDRVVALQNMAERTEIAPFRTLVSALIQTEKFGTSLVDTLRVLAEEQRTTRLFAAEQKAARIPVLITLPLIVCILPAFIMIIVAPPLVKVMNNGGIFGGSAAFRSGR